MDVSSGSPGTMVTFLPQEVLLVDATISLHPFFMHRLDVGPIRLTTITHTFNYRVAVLRDGVKSAAWVGRSRRAAERILEDIGIPWEHQVAVMFQIVCALALDVPSVLQDIESLHGVSPNVSLSCEPWGHTDHTGRDCARLSLDSMGAITGNNGGNYGGFACGRTTPTPGVSHSQWGWCMDEPAT